MFYLYHEIQDKRYSDGVRRIKLMQNTNKQDLEKYIEIAAKTGWPKSGKYIIKEVSTHA